VERVLIALTLPALLLAPTIATALPIDATIDLRAVAADGDTSYLDGGLGELRYDDQHDGLRVGELRIGYRDDFFQIVHVDVQAFSYADHDRNLIDLTEAYTQIRPFPVNAWRSTLKLGAFYAPISLENRLEGWRSPYTISPSAINSWIGDELRTIGVEYDLDWLGRQRGHDWQLGLTGSVFGFNETAGALIAARGWAIEDRQTTLFGRIGEPGVGPVHGLREFYGDIDHRAGGYVSAYADYREAFEVRALHYDNRANPEAHSSGLGDDAWRTKFDSAGVRWTPSDQWTVISQWLAGTTCVSNPFCWEYHSAFLLGSWARGPDRLSARYDGFEMHQTAGTAFFNNNDRGHAWTLAYQRQLNELWSVALEALQIDSALAARASIGEPVAAVERELQLAVRLDL
jgi:hypothetical protein